MKINWKQKLSSRKFWLTVIGFVTAILTVFKVDELTIGQIVTVVSSLGAVVAYVIGESTIDAKRVEYESKKTLSDE